MHKIFELCGSPDEVNWPGVSKIRWYNNFKPARPMRRRLREVFRQYVVYIMLLLNYLQKLNTVSWCKALNLLHNALLQFWCTRSWFTGQNVNSWSCKGIYWSFQPCLGSGWGYDKCPWDCTEGQNIVRILFKISKFFYPPSFCDLYRATKFFHEQRISANDAVAAEYFRMEPLPCDPKRYLALLSLEVNTCSDLLQNE